MVLKKIKLKEWETVKLTDYDTTTLKQLLGLQKRNIIKTSLTTQGILITANSNVGFEVNEDFSIAIEPKISSISMMRMVGFLHGFVPSSEENLAHLGTGENSFRDLLILQWLDLVEKLRVQIRKKYVAVQSNEMYIKGRINVKELAKQGVFTGRTPIEYRMLQIDQPLNQAIKAGLLYFKKANNNPFIVNKIDLLLRNFTGVSTVSLSVKYLEELISHLTRLEEAYKIPLDYLRWLLTVTGVAQGNKLGKAIWVNMNSLFQNYLTKVFSAYISEYEFKAEVSNRMIFKYEHDCNPFNKAHVSIRPDLMVFYGGKLKVIIDFKYKNLIENNVSTSDLYQLSNYGLSFGEGRMNPIILYPAIGDVPDQVIRVNISIVENKQQIIVRGVNLPELERLIEKGKYEEIVRFAGRMLRDNA